MLKVSRLECVLPNWIRVVNAARRTVGKKPINHEPSDKFKRKILLAEHSPIRLLEYDFTWEDIRMWVTTHLVRHHEGCEKFVHTQRTDRNELLKALKRDDLPQGLLNDMDMTCNAQAFINVSRKRLCKCASKETREAWELVIEYLKEVDPILAEKCVPECVYRNFCPETDGCCGYVNTDAFKKAQAVYKRIDNEQWKPIEEFEDYQISNFGEVKCLEKIVKNGESTERVVKEHLVSPVVNKKRGSYLYVHLSKDGKWFCKSVHRLVALAFVDNPLSKDEVNHIDGNKFNNNATNLEWVTSKENKEHAWRTGLCDAKHRMQKIQCIETGKIFESVVECSKIMNMEGNTQLKNSDALSVQIGGNHYKSAYQPIELMEKVNMHPSCTFVFKYVYRHKDKKGLEDLQKALHCVELMEQFGCKFYDGGTGTNVFDDSRTEFHNFIKANEQLDANQIRAILAIMNKDAEELKKVIQKEIDEIYS